MAVRQVEEAELLALQGVTGTLNQMLAHPDSRKLVLQARKIVAPHAPIPELDVAAPVQKELAEMRKLLADDAAARKAERDDAETRRITDQFATNVQRQKAQLRAAGWTDQGIADVETFALERGVPDLEVAASHYEKLHPPAEPVRSTGSGSWGFFDNGAAEDDGAFVKAMIETRGDDEGALNREIQAALADVRGSQPTRR